MIVGIVTLYTPEYRFRRVLQVGPVYFYDSNEARFWYWSRRGLNDFWREIGLGYLRFCWQRESSPRDDRVDAPQRNNG